MEFGIEYPRSGKQIECADEDSARRLFESAPQAEDESLALVVGGKEILVRGRTLAKLRADFPMAAKLYDRLNEHGLLISRYAECIWGGGAPGYRQRIDSSQSGILEEYEAINELARFVEFAERDANKVSIENEIAIGVVKNGKYILGYPMYGAIVVSTSAPQEQNESKYSFSGGD